MKIFGYFLTEWQENRKNCFNDTQLYEKKKKKNGHWPFMKFSLNLALKKTQHVHFEQNNVNVTRNGALYNILYNIYLYNISYILCISNYNSNVIYIICK